MIENITLAKVNQKLKELNDSIIIGDIDNFIIIPSKTHFKGSNLTFNDTRLLLDIYKDKYRKTALKSLKIKDLNDATTIASELQGLCNYEIEFPDINEILYITKNRKHNKL